MSLCYVLVICIETFIYQLHNSYMYSQTNQAWIEQNSQLKLSTLQQENLEHD